MLLARGINGILFGTDLINSFFAVVARVVSTQHYISQISINRKVTIVLQTFTKEKFSRIQQVTMTYFYYHYCQTHLKARENISK